MRAKSSATAGRGVGSSRAAGSKAGVSAASAGKSGKRGGKKTSGGRQRGQMAPTPERIGEIQQALVKNGVFAGEPSGKWDESTSDAMRKFQAAHGLNPTGKLDAPTLNQLGLGAATAGVAAPTPTVRTSSAALPADMQQ
jgi:peptidoglycan hydrolase-like protein with peptidoglycan-binding domain